MSVWTAVTAHPGDWLQKEMGEHVFPLIECQMDRYYGDATDGYTDRTAQVYRDDSGSCHDEIADDLFENVPAANWAVVVSANDTTSSGVGTVFKREAGETIQVDRKEGHEGARGRDVTGYIEEEWGLEGYASWEA